MSLANVSICEEKLSNPSELNSFNSDLDDLIALIENDTSKTTKEESSLVATQSKVVQKDYRSMNLNELLQSIGLTQANRVLIAKLAAAEFLKQNETNNSVRKLKLEIRGFLDALTKDQLTDRQKLHFANYKILIEQIIQRSMAVHRYKIMSESEDDNTNAPLSFSDIYVTDSSTHQLIEKKPNFFVRLINLFRKKGTFKDYKIPYENPEQFAHLLLERTAPERIEIFKQQAKTMGLLSHIEIYHILTTIPAESQSIVYQLLKPNLIGRIDFYPLEVLKLAADVNSEASLDFIPIDPRIILMDIRETGDNLNIFEVYEFLKSLNFNTADISSALTGRKLSLEDFSWYIHERTYQRNSVPFDDALIFAHLFINSYEDLGIIELGRRVLRPNYHKGESWKTIDEFFDLEIKRKPEQKLGLINTQRQSEQTKSTFPISVTENTQIVLLKEFAKTNWKSKEDLKVISELVNVSPVSNLVQNLRFNILGDALNSFYLSEIGEAAGEALYSISKNENLDENDQSSLIKELSKVNWKTTFKDKWLVAALGQMKPLSSAVHDLRIKLLSRALRSQKLPIAILASEALANIARYEQDAFTQKTIFKYCKVDWNRDMSVVFRGYEYHENMVAVAEYMKPADQSIIELQIKYLDNAKKSNQSHTKLVATNALCKALRYKNWKYKNQ